MEKIELIYFKGQLFTISYKTEEERAEKIRAIRESVEE